MEEDEVPGWKANGSEGVHQQQSGSEGVYNTGMSNLELTTTCVCPGAFIGTMKILSSLQDGYKGQI